MFELIISTALAITLGGLGVMLALKVTESSRASRFWKTNIGVAGTSLLQGAIVALCLLVGVGIADLAPEEWFRYYQAMNVLVGFVWLTSLHICENASSSRPTRTAWS